MAARRAGVSKTSTSKANIVGKPSGVSKRRPKKSLPPGGTDCCDYAGQPAGFNYWDGDQVVFLDLPVAGNYKLVVIDGVPRWENNT